MWQDVGVADDSIQSNWLEITKEYIQDARKKLFSQSFIAEVNNIIVASVSCEIFSGLYPNILKSEYRKRGNI